MTMRVWIAAALVCAATLACAKQPNPSQAMVRAVAFDGCQFKMKDPYEGTLGTTESGKLANYAATLNPKARYPFETWIQFSCENPVTAKALADLAGIKITANAWALDPSPENLGPKEAHTTFHALHGKGWEAGGVTQDDVNGDEDQRTRIYAFCIPHKQLALCGVVRYVAYLTDLDESTLPQVIQLLESIEFIDTPPPSPATSSAKP